jgi:hypothetical protein
MIFRDSADVMKALADQVINISSEVMEMEENKEHTISSINNISVVSEETALAEVLSLEIKKFKTQ